MWWHFAWPSQCQNLSCKLIPCNGYLCKSTLKFLGMMHFWQSHTYPRCDGWYIQCGWKMKVWSPMSRLGSYLFVRKVARVTFRRTFREVVWILFEHPVENLAYIFKCNSSELWFPIWVTVNSRGIEMLHFLIIPLTPKIWLWILLPSCHTVPCKLVRRIWC